MEDVGGSTKGCILFVYPQAITARDSMAKSLYSALFDWIVLRINHALLNKKDMEESVTVCPQGIRLPPPCEKHQVMLGLSLVTNQHPVTHRGLRGSVSGTLSCLECHVQLEGDSVKQSLQPC